MWEPVGIGGNLPEPGDASAHPTHACRPRGVVDRGADRLESSRSTRRILSERRLMSPAPVRTAQPEAGRDAESKESDLGVDEVSRVHECSVCKTFLTTKRLSSEGICAYIGGVAQACDAMQRRRSTLRRDRRRSFQRGMRARGTQAPEESTPSTGTTSEASSGENRLPISLIRRFGSGCRGMNGWAMKMITMVAREATNIHCCQPR